MSYDKKDFSLLDEGWGGEKSWDYLALKTPLYSKYVAKIPNIGFGHICRNQRGLLPQA